jgi:hypothetical protein
LPRRADSLAGIFAQAHPARQSNPKKADRLIFRNHPIFTTPFKQNKIPIFIIAENVAGSKKILKVFTINLYLFLLLFVNI